VEHRPDAEPGRLDRRGLRAATATTSTRSSPSSRPTATRPTTRSAMRARSARPRLRPARRLSGDVGGLLADRRHYQPVILLTTSRGGEIGWELEALEGGHGMGNPGGPAMDWASDKYGAEQFPTEATIEAALVGRDLDLPAGQHAPEPAADRRDRRRDQTRLGLTRRGRRAGDQRQLPVRVPRPARASTTTCKRPHNVAAGHIHVGFGLPVNDASAAHRGDPARGAAAAPRRRRRLSVNAPRSSAPRPRPVQATPPAPRPPTTAPPGLRHQQLPADRRCATTSTTTATASSTTSTSAATASATA
jgi:hypothetical protein